MKFIKLFEEYKSRGSGSDEMEDFTDLHIDEISKRFGKTIVKKLGKGSFGNAYLTKDQMVIKITGDEDEYSNALNLIKSGKKYKHIINYYKGYRLGVENSSNYLFALLLDYVTPIPKEDRKYWNEVGYYFFDNRLDDNKFRDKLLYRDEDTIEYFSKYLPQRSEILKEFNEIGELGGESHGGNLGIRDGNIVYFDIGSGDYVSGSEDIYKSDSILVRNQYEKIRKLIQSEYEEHEFININELVTKVSKLLGLNTVKSWKFIRDEINYSYWNRNNFKMGVIENSSKGSSKSVIERDIEDQIPYRSSNKDYSIVWFNDNK